jgi:hypothetical protein
MVLRRWALHIVLALTLVIGQQGAALHALSHFVPESPAKQDKHAPDGGACEKCVAFAKIGSALPGGSLALEALPGEELRLLPATASFVFLPLRSKPARGPPALL